MGIRLWKDRADRRTSRISRAVPLGDPDENRLIHSEPRLGCRFSGLLHRVLHREEATREGQKLLAKVVSGCRGGETALRTAPPVGQMSRSRRSERGDDGAEAQIRTGDTGLFRAVLYQLSYLGLSGGDDRI